MRYLTLRVLTVFLAFTAFSSLQAKKVVYSDFSSTRMEFDGGAIKIETPELFHSLKAIYSDGEYVMIENDMIWNVDWWYQSTAKGWEEGDKLRVYHDSGTWEIENVTRKNSIWGQFWNYDINKLSTIKAIRDNNKIIELEDGKTFETLTLHAVHKQGFQKEDLVFWMHTKSSSTHKYAIWNLMRGSIMNYLKYKGIGKGKQEERPIEFDLSNILELENRLSKQIKGQPEAVKVVSEALLRFSMGLNDDQKPVGAFLFVGPTGVGKTEFCKALARDLLKSESKIIRFNMAEFNYYESTIRLIGLPRGFRNFEDGGELTNAIMEQPNAIVLLDEIEKSHPEVQKLFLSALDEGYIMAAAGERVDCSKCLFVMTSNLGSKEIINMSHSGTSSDEILEKIQTKLLKELSPELFNRLQPVVFRAISEEVFDDLIDLRLQKVIDDFKRKKEITLSIDPTVHDYLKQNGYSAELGARPLNALIEKKIVGYLSKAIISEAIPNGASVWISYEAEECNWVIEWE